MKNLTNKLLVILMFSGLVLLLSGCPPDPSQNNRNAPNQNVSNENVPTNENKDVAYKKCDEKLDTKFIQSIIDRLPAKIKNQFGRNISFSYRDHVLTFEGYIEGKGNLYKLLDNLGKYQGDNCIREIFLVGKGDNIDFEWRIDRSSGDVTPCREADVKTAIEESPAKKQLGKNLSYKLNFAEKSLEFEGHIYGKGKFRGLIDRIIKYEGKNCVSKIVFKKGAEDSDKKELIDPEFHWQICEDGQCECYGGCAPCPCMIPIDTNVNKNTNSNQNGNSNSENSASNSP